MYTLLKHPDHSLPSVRSENDSEYISLIRSGYVKISEGTEWQMNELKADYIKEFYKSLK